MVELDEKQEEIVYYNNGNPLSVEAGPGAGKTRVIIEKIKYLINDVKIDPESLLVITFTRKAAEELENRLIKSNIPKSVIDLMQISTIHGFCSKLLDDNGAVGLDVIGDELSEKNMMFISKHLVDLGFVDEYKIKTKDVIDVMRKYEEYTLFKVNTGCLVDYIRQTRPISKYYLDFVKKYVEENNGEFPFDDIMDDDELKKSYYNAKYLKIAQSYPTYIKLLNDENLTNYSLMQVKTLEILEKYPQTQFKNILIDEFQDTDPVQIRIFEILMEHADSFMVVGDINQSIYGFRGAIENYFEKLNGKYGDNIEQKYLSTNYRSTNQIIDFSEKFIGNGCEYGGSRDLNRDMYYMVNNDHKSEAQSIFDLVLNLKATNKINDYSDIGILFRSVKSKTNSIKPLIEKLEENNIPYQVKGLNDLLEKDEIKSILTLIYHIIKSEDVNSHIFNSWELDWLNVKAFTGEKFNQVLVNLSDETKNILNNVQDKFEAEVLECEKEVHKEFTGKSSRISVFYGVFKRRDKEELIEIFNRVKRPILSNENLIKWGVQNRDDLTFFYLLNELRSDYLNDHVEWKDKDTILEIFYKLLKLTNYLNEDFINAPENEYKVKNLAILTKTLFNYEQIRNPKDLTGAFWFLYQNISEYDACCWDDEGLQIMNVHKAKGLEFPIVIVASLTKDKFPSKFKNPNPEKGWAFIKGKMRSVYYTPYHCLEYKPFKNEQDEKKAHDSEEERIIYVALTRAKDTLILSTVSDGSEELLASAMNDIGGYNIDNHKFSSVPKGPEKIHNCINNNLTYCKPLVDNYEDIEAIVSKNDKKEDEIIKLSFTSLENYWQCPFKYRLANDLGFRTSEPRHISDGIFIHKAFEIINKKIKENNNIYIGDEKVTSEVVNLFYRSKLKQDEDKDKKLERITEDILYYYNNEGKDLEIIDSEVPFYIKNDNLHLHGIIDLIYRTKDGKLGILDYKNTKSENKYIQKYIKQLYTYVIGLSYNDHKYSNQDIDELKIYAIKSKKMISVPINHVEIEDLSQNIDDVVSNIKKENFSSSSSNKCDKCRFFLICREQKQFDLPPIDFMLNSDVVL